MTKEEFAKIRKPSELIRVAVSDARKLDRRKYFPNASFFHNPTYKYHLFWLWGGVLQNCEVCSTPPQSQQR